MKKAHPNSREAADFIKKKLAEDLNLSQVEIGQIMGIKQPSVSLALKGGGLSPDSVNRLIKHYGEEARKYILEGKMNEAVQIPAPGEGQIWRTIPYFHAYASLPEIWDQTELMKNYPNTYVTRQPADGFYCAFEARGDSMENPDSPESIPPGSVLVCRELQVHHWQNRLHLGKVFVIIHRERGCMVKQIIGHDTTTGVITCHSYNEEFQDFKISLNDVAKLFYLKELVTVRDR